MKQLLLICALLIAFTSCVDTPKPQTAIQQPDEENPPMLVAFGTVGDGTSMHSLELINQKGDTLYFVYENNAVVPSFGEIPMADRGDDQFSGSVPAELAERLNALFRFRRSFSAITFSAVLLPLPGLTSTTCLGTSLAVIYSSSWKTVPTNML